MEIRNSQGNQEIQNEARVSGSFSICAGNTSQAISQNEMGTSNTQLSSRTIRLDVQFPKFLPNGDGSCEELARKNFVNRYNGAKYLLAKYGYCHVVKKFISQLQLPESALIRGQNGRWELPDSVPEGNSKKTFTTDDLHVLENRIIKRNSYLANKGERRDMVDAQGRLSPNVPRPVLVGGRNLSSIIIIGGMDIGAVSPEFVPIEAKKNFENYHTGMNYLVKKYGSQAVNEALLNFRESLGLGVGCPPLELDPIRDENGQEQLKPIPRDDTSTLLFNFDNNMLQEFENLIIEHGKYIKDNRILEIARAGGQTLQAVFDLCKGMIDENPSNLDIIIKLFSLFNVAVDDCKLGLEIRNNPDSKDTIEKLKVIKTEGQTLQTYLSALRAMTVKKPEVLDITTKILSHACARTKECDLFLEKLEKAATGKTVSPPVILGEKKKLVRYTDKKIIARENFENFYNSVKYLVEKYGFQSIPQDTLKELALSCDGHIPFIFNDRNQVRFADSVPNGHREKPFTMRNFTSLENKITGKEYYEKAKLAIRIATLVAKSAAAIAALGTGVTIPTVLALVKTVHDDINLLSEIYDD
ncbi:MAG: hypothetical protein LBD34_04225 [Puniceicoccales bacterium]|jgi:hypothetical protein|nr:hypothetical protein [Puniceicoccales bacterium]